MFQDRRDAGRRLADVVKSRSFEHAVVLALPRGGVPVAAEIARATGAPLDLVMVRKLGTPGQPELAMGAVARSGEAADIVLNDDVVRLLDISQREIDEVKERELAEIEAREKRYLAGRRRTGIAGRTAIVVDDGVATGATTCAALRAVRRAGPERLILAVPVAPPEAMDRLRAEADEVIALDQPYGMGAIGLYYRDFRQTSDDEVMTLLDELAEDAGD
ncbi:phosphoribosyltransferase [Ferruginivarius sediminum]|uniref:Phosphoribosyltransferase n=1 Tax=Ferruginivarius sediminum TaxID=2661937 RepID=A0A369T5H7_9PROT|nr:phosphoribosyltransferase family protein [Ferruginivarius sediminum]RDD60580.1 phosphoribosyltransferase [Ferruginivarius sediminum]